jgi:hypothetical protein
MATLPLSFTPSETLVINVKEIHELTIRPKTADIFDLSPPQDFIRRTLCKSV